MKIEVRPAFAMALGLLIALDPDMLTLPFLAAAAIHEAGHLCCLHLCSVAVTRLEIGFFGTLLHTAPMGRRQEALCAAAGPVCSLLAGVLLLWLWRPCGIFSLIFCAVNLLPVFPLDGGRVIAALYPRASEPIGSAALCVLLAAGMAASAVWHLGLWPLLLPGILMVKIAVSRAQEQKLIANRGSSVYNIQR